jgi:endonuclease/exonuclease/phosphatase (EEP) superfamily protein YafD
MSQSSEIGDRSSFHSTKNGSRRVLRMAAILLGWVVTTILGIFALLRIVAWDSLEPLAFVNALTLIVYLPAWPVTLLAAIGRRWWMAACGVLIIAAQLIFLAPEFLAATPAPAWAADSPSVQVFDANLDTNTEFDQGYIRGIEESRADVITLEEFSIPASTSLNSSGLLRQYPYSCGKAYYGAVGFLIASKWPLSKCQELALPTPFLKLHGIRFPVYYMVRAELHTPGGTIALRLVHTLAPLPGYEWSAWSAALSAVDSSVRHGGISRMLMIGDFNATWNNRGFANLINQGLSDGAAARGRAIEMTWPNGAIIPAFVRIDHVLTGTHLAVTKIVSHPGFGSDHRYLTATVAIQK